MNDARTQFREMFPHRVCINIDRRPERWERMQARFAKVDLGPVERFPAVDGEKLEVPAGWPESAGAYGCLRSHLAVVREARALGAPVLVTGSFALLADLACAEAVRGSVAPLRSSV